MWNLENLNEEAMEKQTLQQAEQYFDKYTEQMKILESGTVSKAISLQPHHIASLGKMLDQFKVGCKIMEASTNDLGELPKVGLDVIAATMAESILSVISTTQPIRAQKDIIWFKNLRYLDTKGNVVANEKMVDPLTGRKTPKGYASNKVTGFEAAVGDAVETSFTFAVNGGEQIRSQFLEVRLEDGSAYCKDIDGKGELLGKGCYATVNYATGSITVEFAVAPANGVKVLVDFQQDFEAMTDIPKVQSYMDSTLIEAEQFALKGIAGVFQQFAMKAQFGESYIQDMATDLTREMNAEIGGRFIEEYKKVAQGTVTFGKNLPATAAYSEAQYRESYKFRRSDAEADMLTRAGRGKIKVMIVGREHAAFAEGMNGFNVLSNGDSIGPHILGTHNGVTYIRVPNAADLGSLAGIGLYTGATALESPGVFAPFMPLTMKSAPLGPNPLTEQQAAASMAGVKVVVPQYAVKFDLVNN